MGIAGIDTGLAASLTTAAPVTAPTQAPVNTPPVSPDLEGGQAAPGGAQTPKSPAAAPQKKDAKQLDGGMFSMFTNTLQTLMPQLKAINSSNLSAGAKSQLSMQVMMDALEKVSPGLAKMIRPLMTMVATITGQAGPDQFDAKMKKFTDFVRADLGGAKTSTEAAQKLKADVHQKYESGEWKFVPKTRADIEQEVKGENPKLKGDSLKKEVDAKYAEYQKDDPQKAFLDQMDKDIDNATKNGFLDVEAKTLGAELGEHTQVVKDGAALAKTTPGGGSTPPKAGATTPDIKPGSLADNPAQTAKVKPTSDKPVIYDANNHLTEATYKGPDAAFNAKDAGILKAIFNGRDSVTSMEVDGGGFVENGKITPQDLAQLGDKFKLEGVYLKGDADNHPSAFRIESQDGKQAFYVPSDPTEGGLGPDMQKQVIAAASAPATLAAGMQQDMGMAAQQTLQQKVGAPGMN